ncbi:isocitrate lyase/phosphoenolpyruvate mutase family protein [Sphingomonas changnyeongensis]|uniref:Isocitrate lyase/phosphoenolpyruvate mutase family protein n=1 Tax=Sphingomonas changnyeongensis TaxID=2698679 RepID=A0A7Z2S946_9SPHN|nr:isocitrate lyase/phosphoenolpyruvate mutase family protein [Sphingomonas changnyeongensis]QHL90389.1 isocitrate lyase/phosphoenolpyruvate mutase family protein [Sphingomonas changnyeongensis]
MSEATRQIARAAALARLHVPGAPLILFNVWDAGSARAVAEAGAAAVATGSWSVAAAHGFADGEALPVDLAIANAARIAAAVELPVTIDFEGGYAGDPARLADHMALLLATGAVGCNLEDRVIGGTGLYPLPAQARRIEAMRRAAERAGIPAFINARTDLFLEARAEDHDAALLDLAAERSRAFADAGASGLFVPGLADERLIARLCAASPLPVNVMQRPGVPPPARLAALGVARISHGPGPYRLAMRALADAARAALLPTGGCAPPLIG